MKNVLYFLIATLFLAVACDDSSTSPSNNNEIMPLKIGNSWNYRIVNFSTSGNDTNSYTLSVVGDTMINNEKFFLVSMGSDKPVKMTNRADGLYIRENETDVDKVLLYPAMVGDKFYNNKGDTSVVNKIDEVINVPAGQFSCMYYFSLNEEDTNYSEYRYYAKPGIGLILYRVFHKETNGNIYESHREELVSYVIK